MTGESMAVLVNEKYPALLSGSIVWFISIPCFVILQSSLSLSLAPPLFRKNIFPQKHV